MRWLTLLGVVVSTAALADADPRFTRLRDQAEPLTSIAAFVDRYVGDCGSRLLGGDQCAESASKFRNASNGKKYFMIVTEDSTGALLQLGDVNLSKGTLMLNLTPFFAGSSSAITHGAPSRTDAQGNPVLPFIRIPAVFPDGWNPGLMARQIQSGAIRLQIVFTPQGVWTLPKKGGGSVKGVKARFEAVVVTVGRTGEQVGLWLNK